MTITVNPLSPPQFDLPLPGTFYPWAVYRGVSPAIHVWGEDVQQLPPTEPIDSCRCCAEGPSWDSATIISTDHYADREKSTTASLSRSNRIQREEDGDDTIMGDTGNPSAVRSDGYANDAYIRSFLSHDAPGTAVAARLKTTIWAYSLGGVQATSATWRIGTGAWSTAPPYDSITSILRSGTITVGTPSQNSPSTAAQKMIIEVIVPVVDGRANFVLDCAAIAVSGAGTVALYAATDLTAYYDLEWLEAAGEVTSASGDCEDPAADSGIVRTEVPGSWTTLISYHSSARTFYLNDDTVYGAISASAPNAVLEDFRYVTDGSMQEAESRGNVSMLADSAAIAAGATHIRIRARIYGSTWRPPYYAVPLEWAIWHGIWTGDRFVHPTWGNEIGDALAQGQLTPNSPASGSLSGVNFDDIDLYIPIDAEGLARFVVGFRAQPHVNAGYGSEPDGIRDALRFPNYNVDPNTQSHDFLFLQDPDNTTIGAPYFEVSYYQVNTVDCTFEDWTDTSVPLQGDYLGNGWYNVVGLLSDIAFSNGTVVQDSLSTAVNVIERVISTDSDLWPELKKVESYSAWVSLTDVAVGGGSHNWVSVNMTWVDDTGNPAGGNGTMNAYAGVSWDPQYLGHAGHIYSWIELRWMGMNIGEGAIGVGPRAQIDGVNVFAGGAVLTVQFFSDHIVLSAGGMSVSSLDIPTAPQPTGTPADATGNFQLDVWLQNQSGNYQSGDPATLAVGGLEMRGDGVDNPNWCVDMSVPPGCAECEDPANPGFQLPPFEPGYLPIFRRQIGDPQTNLDSFLCTMESGAMVLDWHTRGAIQVWGGDLVQWCGRSEASIRNSGTNLGDVRVAWLHWNQHLDIRSGQTWADLYQCLLEGRAVILQGDYGVFNLAVRCQDNFEGNHAISVYPYKISDRLLVGDPLCSGFHGVKISDLQDYAETLGAAVYGTHSPQPILFAVSRPWTP